MMARILLASLAVVNCVSAAIIVLDFRTGTGLSHPQTLLAQTCIGIMNRAVVDKEDTRGLDRYYSVFSSLDLDWLLDIEKIASPIFTPMDVFLSSCMSSGFVKGYVRYDSMAQKEIVPNIVTLCAVLDAVPLEDGDRLMANSTLVFDAATFMKGWASYDATNYVFEKYSHLTSSLAFMNPGYQNEKQHPFSPTLTGSMSVGTVDFLVSKRLFTFYLVLGCIPLTRDHALMEKIATTNSWPRPLVSYGYDDTFPVAGDLFEAGTLCTNERNMGQVASDNINNLSFFTHKKPVTEPLRQNAYDMPQYNSSKTYLSIIVGDGDNVAMVKDARRNWMLERSHRCSSNINPRGCFPLLWSMSPRLLTLAPEMLQWFYDKAHANQYDYFVLPPSGDLYSYPSEMKGEDQNTYIHNTEKDCLLMDTSASVAWEFMGTWVSALSHYFPKYSANGIVKSFFAVNVPFMFPAAAFYNLKTLSFDFYKVFGDNVVVFKPREWRGEATSGYEPFAKDNYLPAVDMAKEINGYPRGTVTHIYVTSDGGANVDLIYRLAALLDEHVEIVSHEVVAQMAISHHRLQQGSAIEATQ